MLGCNVLDLQGERALDAGERALRLVKEYREVPSSLIAMTPAFSNSTSKPKFFTYQSREVFGSLTGIAM